ncbi:hypothetical protein FISHEDRAFT_38550 [Fistulina hepatica ATCC 64428]|nr:hypothetical protein FISHEDRAFT_38550 [Fistulina hepatica ATCC 64428]
MSMRSSPSHEPVFNIPPPNVGVKKKRRPENAYRVEVPVKTQLPPRVESTIPPESLSELSPTSDDSSSTAGEDKYSFVPPSGRQTGANDDDDWIDEDEGDEDDLLELEYHPSYVTSVEKRRRRFESRWDALFQAFQALDRQTDATLVLLAAPSHSTKLQAVTSRSIKRYPMLKNSPAMRNIRSEFSRLASQRRVLRSQKQKASLADRFLGQYMSSRDGSSSSSLEPSESDSSREEELRRALNAALGSLDALNGIYEQREARWREEMRRITEDHEKVDFLLRQVVGETFTSRTDPSESEDSARARN